MRIAYFDAFSGISGDMTIGAFLDLGMPLSVLEEGLAPLELEGVTLEVGHRIRSGIRATKFTVHGPGIDEHPEGHGHAHEHPEGHGHAHEHPEGHGHAHPEGRGHAHEHPAGHGHRPYREIRELLDQSRLRDGVRERAQRVFRALAIAEARIHACPVDDVGFHEVGALDAIVDIVGAAICLEHFCVDRIHVCPLPLGSGMTRSQHGVIPVPAPATVEILRGFATRLEDGTAELVTPTGAAIVAALARPERPPAFAPLGSGYGAGARELPDRPNLLRVILGEPLAHVARPASDAGVAGLEHDEMVVLEANVDDMNPEFFEPVMDALFAAGARDVSLSPLTMKRGRPGTLVRAIVAPDQAERLSLVLLRESSTIGVRRHPVSRVLLPRRTRTVSTRFGAIDVKVVSLPDGAERTTPEYADCRRAAREHDVPVAEVYDEARREASKTSA